MAIDQDIENGETIRQSEITEPLIQHEKISTHDDEENHEAKGSSNKGSISMVLISTAVAVCGSFEFGTCVGYSSPAQSAIRNDLGLSLSEYSVFGSILTIGAMIGAVTSGRIADYFGRKGAMNISAVFCIVGWIAICFSWGPWPLDTGRLFCGYGIGVLSYVVPVFIAEIAPKNLRGGLTTVNQLLICTGASVVFIIGTVVSWRMLTLVGLIPCVALLLGLVFVPESPRWLAKVGREKEFESALRLLRGEDADISEEAAEIQDYIETLQSLPKARIQDLFERRYAYSLIVGVGLMVSQQFGGINGISFYASEIFVSAGFSSGKTGTIAMGCIQVPITIVGAILMDKSGRRPLMMISASGTCLGCLLAGVSFFLKGHELLLAWDPILALTGILLFLGSFSIGMGAVPWVMMSEIFPINIKGLAGSSVTLVNWFGSWAVSYTFNFLMSWSSSGTFFLYAGASAITILFVAKVVPETKGRTLEEIQISMNS
ncbi:Sugar/inositol transporter [Cinnamomum micranthum f. kanehirae]|uniref:Sugar/inositol transporter n=1 Tax=Cinnamomum micranthum f. kanehirae TaxID=337451 RepID=A0A3S3R0Z4_9MAGN|nr:Sugar/inositol transporter [Cinnamomum micranthum f. kanehirae]